MMNLKMHKTQFIFEKTKTKIIFFISVFVVVGMMFLTHNSRLKVLELDSAIRRKFQGAEERYQKACLPHKNIAYLKIHKTASSTVENIFFRYGYENNLRFALPRTAYNFASTMFPFKANMIPKDIVGDFDLNIFTLHSKWDYKEVSSVMPSDTIYLVSIREPAALLESLYYYAEFENGLGMSLDDYVARTPIDAPRIQAHLGYNQMAWDFGLSAEEAYNRSAVQKLIKEIDETFDLVLVAEKLDESLILMRHLLCWSYEDIVALKVNARQKKFMKQLKPETLAKLKNRQFTDLLLYNHFNAQLDQLISDFGEEKMATEVQELKRVRESVEKKCKFAMAPMQEVKPGLGKPFSGRVNGFNGDIEGEFCKHFVFSEKAFVDYFREKQKREVAMATAAKIKIKG